MFDLLKKFFIQPKTTTTKPKKRNSANIEKEIFDFELSRSEYFNKEYSNDIFKYITKLNKGQKSKEKEFLSIEEKKELKINTRLKVPTNIIPFFIKEKIVNKNPKDLISNLANMIRSKKYLYNEVKKLKKTKNSYYKLSSVGDEKTCIWCKKMDNKVLSVNEDIIKLFNNNCKCDYPRSTTIAIIEG
ncbi:hypothetical protein CRV00_09945 [Malaciobacter molluscorum]|uniref:hypothetical protein n=1 Tax=Malaciobacter molluscorum TaxID=1032072 RepID=UPI00100B45C3|nr:hypothetical protein [Malaciobacter molluscorum]RXJ93774.1 hypothetical protein CRV00_09945 [Malaciobacter molluscorum]